MKSSENGQRINQATTRASHELFLLKPFNHILSIVQRAFTAVPRPDCPGRVHCIVGWTLRQSHRQEEHRPLAGPLPLAAGVSPGI